MIRQAKAVIDVEKPAQAGLEEGDAL